MFGTSKDIKYPGLNILPPGVERHVVNGGALTAFQIFPDDEIEIILLKNTEKLPTKTKTILRNINFKSSNFNTYFETSSKKLFVYIKEKNSESIKIAISKAVNALKKYTFFYIVTHNCSLHLNTLAFHMGLVLKL